MKKQNKKNEITVEEIRALCEYDKMAKNAEPPRLVEPIKSLDELVDANTWQLSELFHHFGMFQIWSIWKKLPPVVINRCNAYVGNFPPIRGAEKIYGDEGSTPEEQDALVATIIDTFNNVVLKLKTDPEAAKEYSDKIREHYH